MKNRNNPTSHPEVGRNPHCIEDWADDLGSLGCDYTRLKALRKMANQFCIHIKNNAAGISNYAERHRYGEKVSTAFAESTEKEVAA